MEWRLIIDEAHDAYTNMAIDYALLKLNKQPVLRLYKWKPPAVSIGYFQSLNDEIDTEKCEELGVDYVRRITGGGAVFHDHELTYSVTINEDNEFIPMDLNDSYSDICSAVILGLGELGLKADYVPLNDIIVNGRKISGCAQTRKEKKILQHGTLIMDVDVDRMFSVLKVPSEKIRDKLISDVRQRVTSINQELGKDISYMELCRSLKNGFEKKFSIVLKESPISKEEAALAEKIKKEQFSNPEWNKRR